MSAVRPRIFDGRVLAAVSTREGGVSAAPFGMNLSFNVGDARGHVEENRRRFFGALAVSPQELAVPGQVHGTGILRISSPGAYPSTDALLTDRRRVFLCVTIADCVPVLIHATDANAVMAVHAGWRGTASHIAREAAATMMREWGCDPVKMRVYIGPAASSCCYDVGDDVAAKFGEKFLRRESGKTYLDLKAANVAQLTELGVDPRNVEVSPHCTISEPLLFHSYRRDRQSSGRMMAVIGLQ